MISIYIYMMIYKMGELSTSKMDKQLTCVNCIQVSHGKYKKIFVYWVMCLPVLRDSSHKSR